MTIAVTESRIDFYEIWKKKGYTLSKGSSLPQNDSVGFWKMG